MEDLRSILAAEGKVTIAVRVRPSAPQTRYVGTMDDGAVKIDIAAAPEGGKANAELVRFLAKECGVPRSSVRIVGGHADRRKLVRITAA